MTARRNGRTVLTTEDIVQTVADVLEAEYGSGGQHPTAWRVVSTLEDEGVHHDGWANGREDDDA